MHVEKGEDKKVVDYLRQLGLPTDEISAYLYLLANGQQTVLSLSRGLHTGRTKLYPVLDSLALKQLVTVHERHYGTSYQAADPTVLEFLVTEQETVAQTLRSSLPSALHNLNALQMASPDTARITTYSTIDDIKQLYWNISNAAAEYRIIELPEVKKAIGKHLTDKINGLTQLTPYVISNQKAAERYLDPKMFKIDTQVMIYNEVVVLVDRTLHATEIHDKQLARHYTQLFDLLYSLTSTPRQNAT